MLPSNGQTNQRVRAIRGFYAHRKGMFGVVNPGDVVDINVADAKMLRASGKADFVDASVSEKLDPDYVPARKKDKTYGLSPAEKQLAVLTDMVSALQKSNEQNAELIRSLLAERGKPAK